MHIASLQLQIFVFRLELQVFVFRHQDHNVQNFGDYTQMLKKMQMARYSAWQRCKNKQTKQFLDIC